MVLWAGMQTKSKWSPGPGAIVMGVALAADDSWVVSAAGPGFGICPDCCRVLAIAARTPVGGNALALMEDLDGIGGDACLDLLDLMCPAPRADSRHNRIDIFI